jgi:uncharacterized protein (TIGR03435 family)
VLKHLLPVVCAGLALAGMLPAQTPAAPLSFEVASIKQSEPITPAMIQAGKLHAGMKIDGARVDIGNYTIAQLIMKAYDIKVYQIQGPSWMVPLTQATTRFDVVANLPPGATKEQVPAMLQTLLKERFKLEFHKDTKDQNVYALIVGKGGPGAVKVKPTVEAPAADGSAANPAISGSSSVNISQGKGGSTEVSTGDGVRQKMTPSPDGKSMRFEISKATMSQLAEGLVPFVDRPIVDMTEMKGNYDVNLDISMADLMALARAQGANVPGGAPAGAASAGPSSDGASEPGTGSVFAAIQNLGLKLEPRKAPLLLIVVDKVEKTPTDN